MSKHTPWREKLPKDPEDSLSPPAPTVYNLNLSKADQTQIDLDLANTAGANKIMYTSTAEIGLQIIEKGLEVPQQ